MLDALVVRDIQRLSAQLAGTAPPLFFDPFADFQRASDAGSRPAAVNRILFRGVGYLSYESEVQHVTEV